MIEISTLLSLAAAFLRERKTAAGEVNTAEFRQWLEDIAVPQILEASEGTLHRIQLSTEAQQEKLDSILRKMDAIAGEIGIASITDTWDAIPLSDRRLLQFLYEGVLDDPGSGADLQLVCDETGMDREKVRSTVNRLAERGFLKVSESTGGIWLRIAHVGILLAWRFDESSNANDQATKINQVIQSLPRSGSLRLSEITESTDSPSSVVHAYCHVLSAQNRICYRTGYGSIESNLVHSPSQAFLDAPPSLDDILSAQ